MSGFNDPDKLKDALELAQAFKSGNGSNEGRPSRKENTRATYPPRDVQRAIQRAQKQLRSNPPPGPSEWALNIPPPSRRNYAGASTFQGSDGNRGRAIGSTGVDFLLRQDQPKPAPKTHDGKGASAAISATRSSREASSSSSFVVLQPEDAKRENAPLQNDAEANGDPPNILDTFFSLVKRKPSDGQTVESNDKMSDNISSAANITVPTKASSAASCAENAQRIQDIKNGQASSQRLNVEFENRLKALNIAKIPTAPRAMLNGR